MFHKNDRFAGAIRGGSAVVSLCVAFAQAQQVAPAPVQSQITVQPVCPPPATCEGTQRTKAPISRPIHLLVMDQQNRPVPGAAVAIELPADGPSAEFSPPNPTAQFDTDALGRIFIDHLRANTLAGGYKITATASFGGETAITTITERNVYPPFLARHRRTLIILGAISVAIVVPVLALRKSPPPSATITTSGPVGTVGPAGNP